MRRIHTLRQRTGDSSIQSASNKMQINDDRFTLDTCVPFTKVEGFGQCLAFERRKVLEILCITEMHRATDHGQGMTMIYNGRPTPMVDCRTSNRHGFINSIAVIAEVLTCKIALLLDAVHGTIKVSVDMFSTQKWDETHSNGIIGFVFNERENTFVIDLDLVMGPAVKTFLLHRK